MSSGNWSFGRWPGEFGTMIVSLCGNLELALVVGFSVSSVVDTVFLLVFVVIITDGGVLYWVVVSSDFSVICSEATVPHSDGGSNPFSIRHSCTSSKINFDIEKLTSKDLKNILEGLNFDFNNFTKKIISAYEDEEDNMMNILESGRPTIEDEKLIRDVKLDLFFGDKYMYI